MDTSSLDCTDHWDQKFSVVCNLQWLAPCVNTGMDYMNCGISTDLPPSKHQYCNPQHITCTYKRNIKPYDELERYPLPIITLQQSNGVFCGAAENIPGQYTCAVHCTYLFWFHED